MSMDFTTGNLNTKTNANVAVLLKKHREKFALVRGLALQKMTK